ncbi:dolichyl-phosphate-mannose--protein mannosyltransferase [Bifidobacterium sp.]|uniref:dolichyl-phosphate-mannose--protein mannosyltransferase n=1 Tax=Bifidobacterium sp. TaxID=41200 RepID=UPI0025BA4D94|nr:glycosyltransferase family 39 protein [Bifidobacterium sp.]MCH4209874.1 glycosyltransferase family 39 protein [Bifidobacterium sp.]MCI1224489.1 glycosyltransferase family 39 protein [Bifidobacterium sp.]
MWLFTLLIAAFGGLLRFLRLGEPRAIVFDETYYVKDAWTTLLTGEPRNWPKTVTIGGMKQTIDAAFAGGHVDGWYGTAEYVVHPPVGKWLIAAGLKLFGGATNPFAWRAGVAVAGTVAIILMIRATLRLFRNPPVALIAGLLMSLDGVGIVMSRTGLLDNFIMVFALAAFSLLLIHRDWAREQLREHYAVDSHSRSATWLPSASQHGRPFVLNMRGPCIALSWWRAGAAILLGLATGVKWSGIYLFAVFAVISVAWDAWERHQIGYRGWLGSGLVKDALPSAAFMVPLWAGTYVAGWSGWFIHKDSYMHDWASMNPREGVTWLPEALRSFVQYHVQMWQFHTTLDSPHAYKANPLTWPLQVRPTSFYWEKLPGHPGLCSLSPSSQCVSAVTSLGNPLIWWLGSLCVIVGIIVAITKRGDWKIWAVLAGFLGGWLPWAQYLNRTTFTFYCIVILPWIVLAICYVADWLQECISRRAWKISVGVILGLIALTTLFFYPIWTAMPVPYEFWLDHMWFKSWI